ncbi:MAG: DUF4340 domain-containing protein [Pseudomonadota bacterium]
MKRGITPLILVLLIQCALVAAVFWPGDGPDFAKPPPLLPFDLQQIDAVYVGDEFDNETVLTRVGERWSLPELEHLPASSEMVNQMLAALAADDGAWPLADSVSARQRFRVATYHYRRRIELRGSGEKLAVVFLGTSPGFRKIYARNAKQDGIFSLHFSAQAAPGRDGQWLDKNLLRVRTPLRINADAYSLERRGEDWVSGIGLEPDPLELAALLDTLRNLQIEGLASEDMQRDLSEAEADLMLQITSLAGDITLELFEIEDEHYIHSSEYPLFFTISAYEYDRLVGIDYGLISGESDSGTTILIQGGT